MAAPTEQAKVITNVLQTVAIAAILGVGGMVREVAITVTAVGAHQVDLQRELERDNIPGLRSDVDQLKADDQWMQSQLRDMQNKPPIPRHS